MNGLLHNEAVFTPIPPNSVKDDIFGNLINLWNEKKSFYKVIFPWVRSICFGFVIVKDCNYIDTE